MKTDIILSGVGGQGILSIAAVIGEAALKEGLYMKQAEVHGMSQRGGDVQSNLRLCRRADRLGLDPEGPRRFDHLLGTDGELALSALPEERGLAGDELPSVREHPELSGDRESDAELDKLPHKVVLDVEEIAKEAGSVRAANIVMLGAATPFIGIEYDKIEAGIRQIFGRKGEDIVNMNLKALKAGYDLAQSLR